MTLVDGLVAFAVIVGAQIVSLAIGDWWIGRQRKKGERAHAAMMAEWDEGHRRRMRELHAFLMGEQPQKTERPS